MGSGSQDIGGVTWIRREIRELGLCETADGVVLGAPNTSRKRVRQRSTGAEDFRFDSKEVEDSGDKAQLGPDLDDR